MASNHNKFSYTLAHEGNRDEWDKRSTLSYDRVFFWSDESWWPRDKVKQEKFVSPPNFHCFFNSLFAFLRIVDLTFSSGPSVKAQFDSLCQLIAEKYPSGFIGGSEMKRIVNALNLQVISQIQLRTMLKNGATKHIDFARPILLKLDASEYLMDVKQDTGHIGFVVPHFKTKMITVEQITDAIQGVVKFETIETNLVKNKTKTESRKKIDPEHQERASLEYIIRMARKGELVQSTPGYAQEKEWAFFLLMRRLGRPVYRPTKISSALSMLIVSYFYKSRCSWIWEPTGQIIECEQYEMKKYGFVPQFQTVVAVLTMLLNWFVWRNIKYWMIMVIAIGSVHLHYTWTLIHYSAYCLMASLCLMVRTAWWSWILNVLTIEAFVVLAGLVYNWSFVGVLIMSVCIFSASFYLRFGLGTTRFRVAVFMICVFFIVSVIPATHKLEPGKVADRINNVIQKVEDGVNHVGDYYDDHWLDYFRPKPVYHTLPRVSTEPGISWREYVSSLIPRQDGSFLNWLLNRQRRPQHPIIEWVVSIISSEAFWDNVISVFFDGEYDHELKAICKDGLIFADDGWLCFLTSYATWMWNGVVLSSYFPGFLLSWKTLCYIFAVLAYKDWKAQCIVLQGYIAKKVNQACIERVPRQALPHLYRSQVLKTKTDSNRFGGIRVIRTASGKKVVHSPVGIIDPEFNKILIGYGWGFTSKQIAQSSHYSGGHANLRAAVDALQSDMLSRLYDSIVSQADGRKVFQIIDVGAKFSKISRIIRQLFQPTPRDFANPRDEALITPRLTAQGVRLFRQTYDAAITDWQTNLMRYNNSADFILAVGQFLNRPFAVPIQGVPQNFTLREFCSVWAQADLIKVSCCVNKVKYLPVRPRENQYDRNYYAKQLPIYDIMRVRAGAVQFEPVFEGKIQDFNNYDLTLPESQRFFLVFDSHYYLESWKPVASGRVFLVGGDFCSKVGAYRLPLGQGQYRVYRGQNDRAFMSMVCSSSGTFYSHPLVHVDKPQLRMDYGWYAHIAHDCTTSTLSIHGLYLPKSRGGLEEYEEQRSHQANWMVQFVTQCEAASKTATRYSTYDRNFWAPKVVDKSGAWFFEKGKWDEAVRFCQLNHDFSSSPTMTCVRVWGGFLGRLLSALRIIRFEQQVISQHRTEVTSGRFFFGRLLGSRQQLLAEVDRSERIRYGYTPNAADLHLRGGKLTKQILDEVILAQLPKVKQPKIPITLNSDRTQAIPMFFTKPTPPVAYVSQHLIRDDAEARAHSRSTVDRVNQLLQSLGESDKEIRCGMVQQRETVSKVIRTGYSFLNCVREFEWSSKSLKNAIFAMYHRHLSCRLLPEPGHIVAFNRMTDRYIRQLASRLNTALAQQPAWDPVQAIKQKSDFPREKKILYLTQLLKALSQGRVDPGSFMTMVKSGQVNYTDHLEFEGCHLYNQSSRPRNIMRPSQSLCGVLTLLQNVLWKPLKSAQPGFIQGLTKDELLKALTKGVGDHWRVLCIDGSSFDSTQNVDVMQAVDDKFWLAIRPGLLEVLQQLKLQSPDVFKSQPSQLLDCIMKQVLQPHNVCFTYLPGIRPATWPDHIWNLWLRTWGSEVACGKDREFVEANYIFNEIRGTTFSGHPTKTTLGNTLRSLCYAYYYLQLSGIRNPWESRRVHVCAAGDDVIIFCEPQLQGRIERVILETTSRVAQGVVGVGQMVKKVEKGDLSQIDFCSKWAFGNTVASLNLVRDVDKLLSTRQYYAKQNRQFVSHPGLHAKAILEGFKADKVSHLIEDILSVRVAYYGLPEVYNLEGLKKLSDKYRVNFGGAEGYQSQQEVNSRCGITTVALYRLMLDFQLAPITTVDKNGKETKYGCTPSKCRPNTCQTNGVDSVSGFPDQGSTSPLSLSGSVEIEKAPLRG